MATRKRTTPKKVNKGPDGPTRISVFQGRKKSTARTGASERITPRRTADAAFAESKAQQGSAPTIPTTPSTKSNERGLRGVKQQFRANRGRQRPL